MNNTDEPRRRRLPRSLVLGSGLVALLIPIGLWAWPVAPVVVAVRPSPWIGKVLQLRNNSNEQLIGVRVRFFNAQRDQVLDHNVGILAPGEEKEVGWAEGWVMEKGETIAILAKGYRSRRYTTDDLGVNLTLED